MLMRGSRKKIRSVNANVRDGDAVRQPEETVSDAARDAAERPSGYRLKEQGLP